MEAKQQEHFSKSKKLKIQSILIPKSMEIGEQKQWLKQHGFKESFRKKIGDEKEDYIHYRQRDPKDKKEQKIEGVHYITLWIDHEKGIKGVYEIQNKKNKQKQQEK